MSHLYARTKSFLDKDFPAREELFSKLAGGQSPKTLLITCSDSRIDPSLITQTEPGEIFVIRNAGNLVAPFNEQSAQSGEWATIEYAIKVLKVQEILICGHSDCGAMKAVHGGTPTGILAIDGWLKHSAQPEEGKSLCCLIKNNVQAQLKNILTHPDVQSAVEANELSLHGWVYNIGNGQVEEVEFQATTAVTA